MANSLHQHIVRGRDRLVRAGISPREADLDARLLARHVLHWDAARLLTGLRETPPRRFGPAYDALVARRARREPVAQIMGMREFWGLPFEVTPDVLVPRPETELLVEMAAAALREWRAHDPESRPLVADVGTGSGCIAVALALERPEARVLATDLSAVALRVAGRNVVRLDAAERVRLVRTDLLAGLRGPFDLVVSNPPYVGDEEAPALPPEVREHEPHRALFGGPGGLHVIGRLIEQAVDRLRPEGLLLFEFGNAQLSGVEELISAQPRCTIVDVRNDLQGIPRALVARVAGPEHTPAHV